MSTTLEDHSGRDLSSVDFGASAERGPSAPNLPLPPATQFIETPSLRADAEVFRDARRMRQAPRWVLRRLLFRSRVMVTWVLDRLREQIERRIVRRVRPAAPDPFDREDSARTVIAPPPTRDEWRVDTTIVRERRSSSVHSPFPVDWTNASREEKTD